MKLKKSNIILLIIAISISVIIAIDNGITDVFENLSSMNFWYLLIAFIIVLITLFLESLVIYFIVNDEESKFSLKSSWIVNMSTQFFNGITPFSTGGQPMQIWMFTQKGLKPTKATSVAFVNFILFQSSLISVGFSLYLLQRFFVPLNSNAFGAIAVFIGFALNLGVIGVLVLSFNSPKFHYFAASKGINLAAKIKFGKYRLIKDRQKTKDKFEAYIDEFNEDFKKIKKDKTKTKLLFLVHIFRLILTYTIPYVIALALGIKELSMLESIVTTSFIYLIGSSMPLPGGSGGIELGFITFFATFMSGSLATTLMLTWRLITYYIILLLGGITVAISFKNKEKGEL